MEEEFMRLYDYVLVEATINCDKCSDHFTVYGLDGMEACEHYHSKGWRVTGKEAVLCPGCAEQIKK